MFCVRAYAIAMLIAVSVWFVPQLADAQCTVAGGTPVLQNWGGSDRVYVYCSNTVTRAQAITNCGNLATGATYTIVTIDNLTEDTNVDAFSGAAKWIGYNDITTEAAFVWSGLAPSGAYVNAGFYNNNNGRDCTRLNSGVVWQVVNCGNNQASVCEVAPTCGDGYRNTGAGEACDDGDAASGDGCSSTCTIESGYQCTTAFPNVCTLICGDGDVDSGEECDDGDSTSGDGCSSSCTIEFPYTCVGTAPSVCTSTNCSAPRTTALTTKEYVYCNNTTTWATARTYCQGFQTGMDLAVIDSNTENTAIYNLWNAAGLTSGSMFLGGADTTADGNAAFNWRWYDGAGSPATAGSCAKLSGTCTPVAFANWGTGEPNNGNPAQGCISFWSGVPYQWDDLSCTASNVFACEGPSVCGNGIRAPTSEACDDGNTTSGDGCSSTCTLETSPVCGDGNIEGAEACDDSNTTNSDGCSSTCTVEPGYTCSGMPSTCTSICTGARTWLSIGSSNATEYARCTTGATWGIARGNCQSMGGITWNLATVDNGTETTNINTYGLLGGANRWIGVNDTNTEGVYEWSSGTALVYTNWYTTGGEPTPAADDCGSIRNADRTWEIQGCANSLGYLCEGSPICGNGVRASGEACDDGNVINGDGCSSTCSIEGGWYINTEGALPSNISTMAQVCGGGTLSYSSYIAGTSLQANEYMYCKGSAVNWTTAQTACRRRTGWDLAIVNGGTGGYTTTLENTHLGGNTTTTTWLGLNDRTTESNTTSPGTFAWSGSGTDSGGGTLASTGYTNWAATQPNASAAAVDCIGMLAADTWDDLDCTATNEYVCEGPAFCGNGVLGGTENCDDGNTTASDGCSATCTIESGFSCTLANPSVCSIISSISVDSMFAYVNPNGLGTIVEWIGLPDPRSISFSVSRQREDGSWAAVHSAPIEGTALSAGARTYTVLDADGNLGSVYFIFESLTDGQTRKFGPVQAMTSKPAMARPAHQDEVTKVITVAGSSTQTSAVGPHSGCGLAVNSKGSAAFYWVVCVGLCWALLGRRRKD